MVEEKKEKEKDGFHILRSIQSKENTAKNTPICLPAQRRNPHQNNNGINTDFICKENESSLKNNSNLFT